MKKLNVSEKKLEITAISGLERSAVKSLRTKADISTHTAEKISFYISAFLLIIIIFHCGFFFFANGKPFLRIPR